MWVVDEIKQIVKDMLLAGNLHNIIVFTIITSSSLLSVVGALKHIYTFVYKLRHGQEKVAPKAEIRPMTRCFSSSFPSINRGASSRVVRRTKSSSSWSESKAKESFQYGKNNRSLGNKVKGLRCLKCDSASWQRHCAYGLCDGCCEGKGGCQKDGHRQRPSSYSPWPVDRGKCAVRVDLSNMSLQEVPERLGYESMDATSVDMSHNCLADLPEHMSVIRGLMNISLHHNLFSHIPHFFRSLNKLTCLDLRNNSFCVFPETVLELPQLQKLLMDNNGLNHLPSDIDRLHSLDHLSVGNNGLTTIPKNVFNLRRLRVLSFRGNSNLSVLPCEVKNLIYLRELDLSYCDICLIPVTINSCSMLRKLTLSHNRLTHLPNEISQCYRLRKLAVTHNCLSYLPADLLYRKTHLSLTAGNNQFMSSPLSQPNWVVLDDFMEVQLQCTATLKSLALDSILRNRLVTEELPLPLQEELSAVASCCMCGRKELLGSTRVIRFTHFGDCQNILPFLHSFCTKHFVARKENSVAAYLDTFCDLDPVFVK